MSLESENRNIMGCDNSCGCSNNNDNCNCECMQDKREEMMQQIKSYNFAVIELALYLDTHPDYTINIAKN